MSVRVWGLEFTQAQSFHQGLAIFRPRCSVLMESSMKPPRQQKASAPNTVGLMKKAGSIIVPVKP